MHNFVKTLSGVLMLIYLPAALAENDVIGTVELKLGGKEQVWYVLDPGSDTLPTALWMAMGPEKGALSIAAYKNADVQLVRDDKTGSAIPAGDAEVLVISIAFPIGAVEQSYTLPQQPPAGPASILFLPDWSDPLNSYDMSGDPGQMSLTEIDANTDGPSRFVGAFSGLLRNDAGDTMTVEDGRFEVDRAPFFK